MGGASCTALSSKPCEEEWPADVFIQRMTFAVQFVGSFSNSQSFSHADTDSVKPV